VKHAVEGFGKTSWAAYSTRPVFMMARGETGLETLIAAGQIPETPHFPEIQTWEETFDAIRFLHDESHEFRTLVLDTMNGFERLCHEHVCIRDFNGLWDDKGFLGYMRGYEVALADWREFLTELDKLREKGMAIIALCHSRVATFKNPEGPDYDRYEADMHRKTWGLTHKWADMVLFGNWLTLTDDKKKGKAQGGHHRILYTERTAAYDAKNRHGLPPQIELPDSSASV
jgi:hypothetical protein